MAIAAQGVVTLYAHIYTVHDQVKMWSRGQGPSDAVVKGSKAFTMDGWLNGQAPSKAVKFFDHYLEL